MNDELIRLPGAMEPVTRPDIQHHTCEHPDCGKDAGWGFAKPRRPSIGSALSTGLMPKHISKQRVDLMIRAPIRQGDYADREIDCQEAMEPGFQAIADC